MGINTQYSVFSGNVAPTTSTKLKPESGASSFSDALDVAKHLSPAQELEKYLNMSQAERYQEAWLKRHGLTKEQFDALPADEKAKMMADMQQDMHAEIQKKMEEDKQKKAKAFDLFS